MKYTEAKSLMQQINTAYNYPVFPEFNGEIEAKTVDFYYTNLFLYVKPEDAQKMIATLLSRVDKIAKGTNLIKLFKSCLPEKQVKLSIPTPNPDGAFKDADSATRYLTGLLLSAKNGSTMAKRILGDRYRITDINQLEDDVDVELFAGQKALEIIAEREGGML